MSNVSRRTLASGYEVDFEWSLVKPVVWPKDDEEWLEVLRRPPQTWSVAEVAHWAQRPAAQGGGQLGDWVARRLWENAIDGHLLLTFGGAGGGGAAELGRALGISEAAPREALAKAVAELGTLQDRIRRGAVRLPPPQELQQPAPPPPGGVRGGAGAAANPAAARAARPGSRQQHDRWAGVWGAGGAGAGGPGRPVSLSEKEQLLHAAKEAAAAEARKAGTATERMHGGAGPSAASGSRAPGTGPYLRSAAGSEGKAAAEASGRRRSDDAAPAGDQRRRRGADIMVGAGGKEEGAQGAGDTGRGSSSAEAAPGATGRRVLGEVRRMAELVAAHEDVVRRLQVLRTEGPGGLARFEPQRRAASAAAAAAGTYSDAGASEEERSLGGQAAAASAGAAASMQGDHETLAAVEQRGRLLRQKAQEDAAAMDDVTKVPLRRGMRNAAAAAEAAAAASSARTQGADRGSGGAGFAGAGPTRVQRGGWREVDEAGAEAGASSWRQSLSAAGLAALEETDWREEAEANDPWVYDDDDDEGGQRDSRVPVHSVGGAVSRTAAVGKRSAASSGLTGGREEARRGHAANQTDAQSRTGANHGGRSVDGVPQRARASDVEATAAVAAASVGANRYMHRFGSQGAGASSNGRAAGRGGRGVGPLRALPGLLPGRGREPGSHETHPPRPAPDPWRTADPQAVKRVLSRGASTPVHHTLKSKLAQDAVRHMYGIAPPEATTAAGASATRGGVGGGGVDGEGGEGAAVPFYPPASLLSNQRAAAHEVSLRRQMGLPVTPDLIAARTIATPKTARLVVRATARPQANGHVDEAAQQELEPNVRPGQPLAAAQPASAGTQSRARVHFASPISEEHAGPATISTAETHAGSSAADLTASRRMRPASAPSTAPMLPPGRLVPPEAHVRGIGGDEELRRAITARAAAAGASTAAVTQENDGVVAAHSRDRSRGRVGGPDPRVSAPAAGRSTSATRAHGMVTVGSLLQGAWGDPELQQSVREVLHLLDGGNGPPALGGVPPRCKDSDADSGDAEGASGGTQEGPKGQRRRQAKVSEPTQVYRFKNGEMVYTGRRPPFDAKPEVPYELPGWHPRPMGQTWTKLDAERHAGAVSAEARGNTELHWAAGRGDAGRVAELLTAAGGPEERREAANRRNQSGETPLHRAASCRGARAVGALELLLAAGAEVDPRDVNGATPLMAIVTSGCWQPEGNVRARTLLAAGASEATCDITGETLLHKAIIHNLCKSHDEPDSATTIAADGQAAPTPGSTDLAGLLEMLLPLVARERLPVYDYGPDDSEQEKDMPGGQRGPTSASGSKSGEHGDTRSFARPHPLAAAAAAGTAGALLATAVAAAAAAKTSAIAAATAEQPRRRGSALGVDCRDTRGRTPLHLACSRPHVHGPSMEGCCVVTLLRAGADPNAEDDTGRRPLHWVLAEAAAAARLREANAINHAKLATSRPKQPAGAMCWVAEQLLRSGADASAPEGPGGSGLTPLHMAAQARSRPLLRLLLRCGADPRVADRAGRTPGQLLQAALKATRDRQETAHLQSLLGLVQKYESAVQKSAGDLAGHRAGKLGAGHPAAAPVAGAGGPRRPAWDKPGLGGGAGPKTLRQLYRERFGDSSEEGSEEEVRAPPTQHELAQAYMAAMRAHSGPAPIDGSQGPNSVGASDHAAASTQALPAVTVDGNLMSTHEGSAAAPAAVTASAHQSRHRMVASSAPGLTRDRAATRIQAAFRGHRTRRMLQASGQRTGPRVSATSAGHPPLPWQPAAARGVSSAGGGHNRGRYGPEHERAATRIQAAVRGRAARTRAAQLRAERTARTRPVDVYTRSSREVDGAAVGLPSGMQQVLSGAASTTVAPSLGTASTEADQWRIHPPSPVTLAKGPPNLIGVFGPGGYRYGAQHERAATRIQAAWKGRQARKAYERVRSAAAEEADVDLGLDEEELLAMSRGVATVRLRRPTLQNTGDSGLRGRVAGSGGGDGGGGVGSPGRYGYAGSEGGGSDKVAPSVGGWSAASTAVSLGLESLGALQAPEAPPLRLVPRAARGAAAAAETFSFVPVPSTGESGTVTPGRGLHRSASSRRGPAPVPQVALTADGQFVGDVDDLDLLDLHDDGGDGASGGEGNGEDGGLEDDDGSLPSGIVIRDSLQSFGAGGGGFAVTYHDDGDDGDSVF